MRHIGAFLALEDDGTRLQGFHGVPDILSYIHTVVAFRWVEDNVFDDGAVVVVGDDTYPATQHNKCLLFLRMAMNGDGFSCFPLFCVKQLAKIKNFLILSLCYLKYLSSLR